MNELQDIYFPVSKLPVPPEEVDLIRIKLLGSIFKPDENGNVKEYRQLYYETSFQGRKVSDGNNYIPSELVPLIFNAKENVLQMDYAMRSFGFAINHDVFDKKPNVFENPFQSQVGQTTLPQPILPQENGKESASNQQANNTNETGTVSNQSATNSQGGSETTVAPSTTTTTEPATPPAD